MRHTTKNQRLTPIESRWLPYRAPEVRVFTFRSGGVLCASGDLIDDDEGSGTYTGNSGEGTGSNQNDP